MAQQSPQLPLQVFCGDRRGTLLLVDEKRKLSCVLMDDGRFFESLSQATAAIKDNSESGWSAFVDSHGRPLKELFRMGLSLAPQSPVAVTAGVKRKLSQRAVEESKVQVQVPRDRRLILLNGPPRSGKDLGGAAIKAMYPEGQVELFKCADPLKDCFHGLFGSSALEIERKGLKEKPIKSWSNIQSEKSARQGYIWFSEEVIKPEFGQDVFGILLGERVKTFHDAWSGNCEGGAMAVVTDTGFKEEVEACLKTLGSDTKVLLIRCHRPGTSFAGDSRSYISVVSPAHAMRVTEVDLDNDGTSEHWLSLIQDNVRTWIKKTISVKA